MQLTWVRKSYAGKVVNPQYQSRANLTLLLLFYNMLENSRVLWRFNANHPTVTHVAVSVWAYIKNKSFWCTSHATCSCCPQASTERWRYKKYIYLRKPHILLYMFSSCRYQFVPRQRCLFGSTKRQIHSLSLFYQKSPRCWQSACHVNYVVRPKPLLLNENI